MSESCCERVECSGTRAIICVGGPIQTIQVNGRRYRFEMHHWCGPIALNKRGDEAKKQPIEFLEAASFWAQQGRRVDADGLCIWERVIPPQPIKIHLGGNHYLCVGETPEQRFKGE